jgi:hypothetical protein
MFRARSSAAPPNSNSAQPATASLSSSSPPRRNSQRTGLGGVGGGGGFGGGTSSGESLRYGCRRLLVVVAAIAGLLVVGRPGGTNRSLHDKRWHLLLLSHPHDAGSDPVQNQPRWLTPECRRAVDKLEMGTSRMVGSVACSSQLLSTFDSIKIDACWERRKQPTFSWWRSTLT